MADAFKWYEGAWSVPVGSMAERLVLLAIAKHADSKGESFPAQSTLADLCDMSCRTVGKSIARLQDAGHITAQKRFAASTVYRLHFGTSFRKEARSERNERQKGTSDAPFPNEVRTSSEPASDKLSIELSNELSRESETRDHCEKIFDHWNAMRRRIGKSTSRKLTAYRRSEMQALLCDETLDAVLRAIDDIPTSRFLRGDVGKWNGADLKWLLKPDNLSNVLDGKYRDREPSRPTEGFMGAAMDAVRSSDNPQPHQHGQRLIPDNRSDDRGQVLPFDRSTSAKG